MTAARCRSCHRRLRRPSPDGYGPHCRRRARLAPAVTAGLLPPPLQPAPGQLAFDEPTTVPCSEWPTPRAHRPVTDVNGPDTRQNDLEENHP